jgi:DNA-binding CsgD family transcriptional regulator
MDLTLGVRDQTSLRRLLLATPQPGWEFLPPAACQALVRLIPCDVMGAGEMDDDGYLLRGFEMPAHTYDAEGTRVCHGPVPTGLTHLGDFPLDDPDVAVARLNGVQDTLRVSFLTPSRTVKQVYLDRRNQSFSPRDVAMLSMVEPVIGRLLLGRPRLAADVQLSGSEHRVLELVAAGGTNQAVAEHLRVSVATVRKHLEHSYRKLGVSSRTAAVAVLRDAGRIA